MKRFMTVLMMLALLISTVSSCAETANRTTKITAHFASVEEGQELIRDRTVYHEQINEGTLAFLLQKEGGTLDDYMKNQAIHALIMRIPGLFRWANPWPIVWMMYRTSGMWLEETQNMRKIPKKSWRITLPARSCIWMKGTTVSTIRRFFRA